MLNTWLAFLKLLFPASFNLNCSQLTLLPPSCCSVLLFPLTSSWVPTLSYSAGLHRDSVESPMSLPAHQTADPPTPSRLVSLCSLVSLSCFWLFALTSRSKVKTHKHKRKMFTVPVTWHNDLHWLKSLLQWCRNDITVGLVKRCSRTFGTVCLDVDKVPQHLILIHMNSCGRHMKEKHNTTRWL